MRVPAVLRTGVTREEYLADLRQRRAGRQCAAPGCGRISSMRTFCEKHASRVQRVGSPLIPGWSSGDILALANTTVGPFIEGAMRPMDARRRPNENRGLEFRNRAHGGAGGAAAEPLKERCLA